MMEKRSYAGWKGTLTVAISSVVVCGIIFSCADQQKAAPPPSVPQAVRNQAAPEVKAVSKPAESADDVFAIKSKQFDYAYNPIQKRDPFKPYDGEVTYFNEPERTPLERFDISQLELTAIVWGISEPRALIRAPDGQDYIVKKDMRIGRNSGRIARITKRELVVAEEYRDPLGKVIVKETPILLREKNDLEQIMSELQ